MFFPVLLFGLLSMSLYVWWRAGSVAWVRRRLPAWPRGVALAVLGGSYIGAREAESAGWPSVARALEFVGTDWIGVLLLMSVAMVAADVLTGFGWFFRRHVESIRGWALLAGVGLTVVAVVQGNRAPVVRDYEVRLAGLPAERDGTVLVFISDLHAGSLLGERWLTARIAQVSALRADAIIVGGDILEGDSPSERALVPLFGRLSAPLGVYAVSGNHESYGGGALTLAALERHGIRALRNEWRELAPGLVLAGIEDRLERRADARSDRAGSPRQGPPASADDRLTRALAGRPAAAATVLVSHRPTQTREAAGAGVGLMLSGHTHDGQIWPFRYLVRLQFPYLAGRYDIGGMALIVCRGTGTFGPRMRLWYPSEILRITLRAK